MRVINGNELAKKLIKEIKEIKEIKVKLDGNLPKIKIILVGDSNDSKIYIKYKTRLCEQLGIEYQLINLEADITQQAIEQEVRKLNEDPNTTGILLQLPLPSHLNTCKIINLISPNKDLDGITAANLGKLMLNESTIIPCTVMAILYLLKHTKINIEGKIVSVIGRSNIVGKPTATSLINLGATVITSNSYTKDLATINKTADIIISATGQKHIINLKHVKAKAIVIDVGISREKDQVYGDVDLQDIKDQVAYVTPVPGGVGPLTVSFLIYNAMVLNGNLKKTNVIDFFKNS